MHGQDSSGLFWSHVAAGDHRDDRLAGLDATFPASSAAVEAAAPSSQASFVRA